MSDLALLPEEIETLREDKRCSECGHLMTFHQYAGGGDECYVNGCSCEI